MTWILWAIAAAAFLRWATRTAGFWWGTRRLPRLDAVSPDGSEPLPRLSIVVPALNEEATAEPAMRTLLALDYPDLEIVAVNDRSTDRTGEILDRLSAQDPRLRVLHVRDLPAGWLGKNHALHLATTLTTGRWILFTDADIHFDATALQRAVRYAESRDADHLVVLPEILAVGFWEKVVFSFFWTLFAIHYQPWKVSNPRSPAHIGVGAFNLVRSEAYCRCGGHAAMRMEVLDDVKLGKRLKMTGARQVCIGSGGLVRVRWLVGLRGIAEGLSKNLFAALGFSLPRVVLSEMALFLAGVWPLIGIAAGPWGPRLVCAATFACMVWAFLCARPTPGVSVFYAFGFPLATLIFMYILARSTALAYARGGVVWRGTLYPLEDLRKGVV